MKLLNAIIFVAACAQPIRAQDLKQAPDGASQAERERIAQERTQAEARFVADQKACYSRFAVNDCLDQAQLRRRERLADLRRQEVSLNDADRKRKGAEQIQRMEDKTSAEKQQEQADKRAQALQEQKDRVERSRQRALERQEREAQVPVKQGEAADRQKSAHDKTQSRQQKSAEAAGKKRDFDEKIKQAAEHRASLERRLAEKDKPPAKPLPLQP